MIQDPKNPTDDEFLAAAASLYAPMRDIPVPMVFACAVGLIASIIARSEDQARGRDLFVRKLDGWLEKLEEVHDAVLIDVIERRLGRQ